MINHGQENIEKVKGLYRAIQGRDFTAAGKLLDSNVEWIEPKAEGLWFSGTHRGANAVRQEVIEPAFDQIADFGVEPNQFFGVGECVVVTARFCGRVKATGKELNVPTAHIYTLRNGKIVRFYAYHDIAAWQEALGATQAETRRMAA
jgi:ketosteroid isomerase-like protein